MSSKIKLTKGELKRQRDDLKQYRRYLPTLQLKKQQLQSKIHQVRKQVAAREKRREDLLEQIRPWAGLLADPLFDIEPWLKPSEVRTSRQNIAGADVPIFEAVTFPPRDYDVFATPFWTDRGIDDFQELIRLLIETEVLREQARVLEHELRVTTQRVNLFEKVKIPECQDNIRKIRIYLGDQQANMVGVSKVAKKKLEMKLEAAGV